MARLTVLKRLIRPFMNAPIRTVFLDNTTVENYPGLGGGDPPFRRHAQASRTAFEAERCCMPTNMPISVEKSSQRTLRMTVRGGPYFVLGLERGERFATRSAAVAPPAGANHEPFACSRPLTGFILTNAVQASAPDGRPYSRNAFQPAKPRRPRLRRLLS